MANRETVEHMMSTPGVLAYPSLVEARGYKGADGTEGPAKYKCNVLFGRIGDTHHPEIEPILRIVYGLSDRYFPGSIRQDPERGVVPAWPTEGNNAVLRLPTKEAHLLGTEGHEAFKNYLYSLQAQAGATTKAGNTRPPPGLAVIVNNELVNVPPDQRAEYVNDYFFPGALVLAKVAFAKFTAGTGITCYLNGLVSVGKAGARWPNGMVAEKIDGFGYSARDTAASFRGHLGQILGVDPIGAGPALGSHPTSAPLVGQPIVPPAAASGGLGIRIPGLR